MASGARSGILRVDKPVGPTSHDVVAVGRRALGIRRIGHAGTLDPFASGLLLLCIGTATRLSEYLTGLGKTYRATAVLGTETDTEDRTGTVISENTGWRDLSETRVREALDGFAGDMNQIPPQYSAKKVDGVAMHRRARSGEHVDLAPVPVRVYSLELISFVPPMLDFEVACSSGTYVRSLARDIGRELGVGAHLDVLRRISIGDFSVEGALTPDELGDPKRVGASWVAPAAALGHLPVLHVETHTADRLRHGQAVPADEAGSWEGKADDGLFAVLQDGRLIAVASVADGRVRPRKVFPE